MRNPDITPIKYNGTRMIPSAELIAAQQTILNPCAWTRDFTAVNANGAECDASDKDAACFCSLGALLRTRSAFIDNTFFLARAMGYTMEVAPFFAEEDEATLEKVLDDCTDTVAEFNDSHTHEEVMRAWEAAIKEARAEGY